MNAPHEAYPPRRLPIRGLLLDLDDTLLDHRAAAGRALTTWLETIPRAAGGPVPVEQPGALITRQVQRAPAAARRIACCAAAEACSRCDRNSASFGCWAYTTLKRRWRWSAWAASKAAPASRIWWR